MGMKRAGAHRQNETPLQGPTASPTECGAVDQDRNEMAFLIERPAFGIAKGVKIVDHIGLNFAAPKVLNWRFKRARLVIAGRALFYLKPDIRPRGTQLSAQNSPSKT